MIRDVQSNCSAQQKKVPGLLLLLERAMLVSNFVPLDKQIVQWSSKDLESVPRWFVLWCPHLEGCEERERVRERARPRGLIASMALLCWVI